MTRFCIIGGQKNFFRGPYPQTGSRNGREQREIGRAWREVSGSEKVLENSQGLPRYMGSKKNLWRHLAAKREQLGGGRNGEFVEALRPTMCESMATVGFLELEIWCTKVCIGSRV